jgi:exoribonuclease II
MRDRKIIEINPPASEGYEGLYRLSIKDGTTGTIYPMDVTSKGLAVILLEKQILKFCPADLVQNYKDAIIAEIDEGI